MSDHGCPRRGCPRRVPVHLFCCVEDWLALPVEVRRKISRTAGMGLLSVPRRQAIKAALDAWADLPG